MRPRHELVDDLLDGDDGRLAARTASFCTPERPQSMTLPLQVGLLGMDDGDVGVHRLTAESCSPLNGHSTGGRRGLGREVVPM